jgi:uncharacterized membrane protein YfcA
MSAGTVFAILGFVLLIVAAILIWIGVSVKNKEEAKPESDNPGWWTILIGVIIFFLAILSFYTAIVIPKPKAVITTKAGKQNLY